MFAARLSVVGQLPFLLYREYERIFGPYLKNVHGIGSSNRLKKPKRLAAQLVPRPLNICIENNGKAAAYVYRAKPLLAIAEAPYNGPKQSTIYNAAVMNSDRLPIPKGIPASVGEIQWTEGFAVQANQNNPIGMPRDLN
jgi:hypothetical protein